MKKREAKIYKVTLIGTAVNAILIVVKLLAGIFGRSSALIADAVHSLSDFITDVIVLIFVRIAGKPRDKTHDYGHGKYETFASLIIGVMLSMAGIVLLVNGVKSVWAGIGGEALPRPSWLALGVAAVSIALKEWLYHYTVRKGRELDSKAVVANAWHHRSDAISSVGTFFGVAGAMFLGENWRILDPVAAVLVSLLIIKSAWDIMKPSVDELLETSLPPALEREIVGVVLSVEGIEAVRSLRTRRIGNGIAIDLTIRMDGSLPLFVAHSKATEVENLLREKYGANTYINIHMEPVA